MNEQIEKRISALHQTAEKINSLDSGWEEIKLKAFANNSWFIPENIQFSWDNIKNQFLDEALLKSWVSKYHINKDSQRSVALIMAGNIPLVGFHDFICLYLSGHNMQIKLSDKDKFILPFFANILSEFDTDINYRLSYPERLKGFDAAIATGSNNSSRHFEQYFKDYPNIIRKNRNGVAILTGQETDHELEVLGNDVFSYFGLGCRNVSMLYLPKEFDFPRLLSKWEMFSEIAMHNKYKNNYDYNYAIYLLNQVDFLANDSIVLLESPDLSSRIACLHYQYFSDQAELEQMLKENENLIQCVVSTMAIDGVNVLDPGTTQRPDLNQYADGVDTMEFLTNL